ncbi:uncharacterized protein ATC70_003693 [Mucor velutinosus]|uniref:Uncharacterized protein n=1 Tax=Mucor velutinosus TaxID=708070 RepID=A0AAN7D9Y0_9FUNG|nr:hypothetical protein ATC70_003693 [Mucor velutinosus]
MSDLTNNINSAINPNTAKNRKKKAKKKAKKQNTTDSSNTASEISTPNLTDKENMDPIASIAERTAPSNTAIITETQTTPANTSTLTGEGSVLATSLPAMPIDEPATVSSNVSPAIMTETQTTPANTSTLTGEGSVLATSLPAKPIDSAGTAAPEAAAVTSTAGPVEGSIHDKNIPAAGPVGPGAAGATAAGAAIAAATVGATTAATGHSGGFASLPKPLPLSENVQYAIKTVIASGSIDLYSIIDKIKSNVAAGDYKEKAKLPPNATANNKQAQVPTATANNKDLSDSSKNPLKKAAAGVEAAVVGATAAVAGGHKSGNRNSNTTTTTTTTTATDSKINNKSAPLPPTPQSAANTAKLTTPEVSKLSENVQYCIKSAVQAPSVDVYGIINPSQKVKRPEAAVGSSTQPTMPSSAKAPDVPKKTIKSPEHRHKPSFLKKKNCIIL